VEEWGGEFDGDGEEGGEWIGMEMRGMGIIRIREEGVEIK